MKLRVNGSACDVDAQTIVELLEVQHLPLRGVAVALDGEIVPRSQWASTTLTDGSTIEVVTAAAGG
jgi:sulfur carrier protein